MEQDVVNGVYARLPNETLARVVDANLRAVGGVTYIPEERTFAERLRQTLRAAQGDNQDLPPVTPAGSVIPFRVNTGGGGGSTDVGDVSWVVPNGRFSAATWLRGTPAHSWQAVAAGGMSIGHKGMLVAAKTLALTVHDLMTDASTVQKGACRVRAEARAEFCVPPADRGARAAAELSLVIARRWEGLIKH